MNEQRLQTQYNIENFPLEKIQDSIKVIFDLTARIDERVQLLMQQQKEFDRKIDIFNDLNLRVKILEGKVNEGMFLEIKENRDIIHLIELKMQKLENSTEGQENRWKVIIDLSIKFIWVILAAFVLYKLGINGPVTP